MVNTKFIKWFYPFILLIAVLISSCQKDDDVKDINAVKSTAVKDSSATLNIINTPGNFLAVKGTLKITIEDSTYTFNASKDSIAFINVHNGDNKYFGITAIDKAHKMSFGISSLGFAATDITGNIAGSQFLLKLDDKRPLLQYTLTNSAEQKDLGNIYIEQYNNKNIIAKGTFFTFLAKDDKPTSPFYRADGIFELELK